jgi:hypothetical protein
MSKKLAVVAVAVPGAAGIADAQFPVMDKVADKVILECQISTCKQLGQEKAPGEGQPKPQMEQRAVQMLKQEPQARQAFYHQVVGAP